MPDVLPSPAMYPCGCPRPHPYLPIDPVAARGVSAPAPDTAGGAGNDQPTFQAALNMLRSVRADLRNNDAKVVEQAHRRLIAVASYLVGYCDGRGIALPAASAGLEGILAVPNAGLDGVLDELERRLDVAASSPDTRLTINWVHAAGAVLQAAGMAIAALL